MKRLQVGRAGWLSVAAWSLLFVAAACAAEEPSAAAAKGVVDIVIDGMTCTVEPQRVIIDYGQDRGYPTKVKFKMRKGKSQRVRILAAPGQSEPDLFGELPVFEPGKEREEKDAAPKREPKWSPENDFNFRYKVEVGGVICDPDICVRNGGSGCPV